MNQPELHKFRDKDGKVPFDEWFVTLKDRRIKARIQICVDRLTIGLEGDWKPVGDGVREMRIHEGPGYRVYYAWQDKSLVLLLCGGDKTTQERDIETAKNYWRQYRGR